MLPRPAAPDCGRRRIGDPYFPSQARWCPARRHSRPDRPDARPQVRDVRLDRQHRRRPSRRPRRSRFVAPRRPFLPTSSQAAGARAADIRRHHGPYRRATRRTGQR
jgi:hypothetical protein